MAKELPEDLVTEILLCLPVASVLRCKCVCKSWYALITHQKFVAKHILHNKKNSNTLLLVKMRDEITKNDVVSTLSYETLQVLHSQPLPPPFIVLGSCNGLVCLHDDYALRVVLWNPATKETKVVPKSNLPHFISAFHKLGVDGIGFGFDAKTNDYKIINLLTIYESHSRGKMAQSEVYSLNADSWRKVDPPPFSISPVYSSVRGMNTYTNGMASLEAYGDNRGNLLSFDMSNEVFLKTPKPDDVFLDEFSDWTDIFVLNESIALVVLVWDKGMSEICYDIWLLLEVDVKDSWTKLFSIGPFTDFKQPRPLGFWKNDAVLFENLDGQMVLYDPSTKEMTNLPIHGETYSLQLVTYMETLVSVNGRK
ncbi:F-box/kelch-repeat protein At3g23880-like [Corylus avellana]|uniref:F-box/kelch-repeat protein At3g23880-like n=1 Tax=Corylus avellana TaxID=13451 RepID=UPI001E1EEFFA|nr:F-box/kelch-repeat protein At3g23880-like [Corylus avellana]